MAAFSDELVRRLAEAGQDHLSAHAELLPASLRARFEEEVRALDLEELRRLKEDAAEPEVPSGALAPPATVVAGADPEADERAATRGRALLAEGRVAVFLVAGGQGSRLGHDGPKGTFAATPLTGRTLFDLFARKLEAVRRACGRPVHLWVMTSPGNHAETLAAFEGNGCYGLERETVHFVTQGTMPALDADGRVIVDRPGRLFRSPDGHGGSLLVLERSGALGEMAGLGIEHVFYFQVDNPLVRVCDPVYLGYHAQSGSDFSSKAVPKRDPDEKVGVLVTRGGRPGVIEYSDMPAELREARDAKGQLKYRAGNVAIHVLRRDFIERVAGDGSLPWHRARKQVACKDLDGTVTRRECVKFETFVFDALPRARSALVMEVARHDEFSPIKNADGPDSPETSRRDQVLLHAGWLEHAGCRVPRAADGTPLHAIEISPLFADGPQALRARKTELPEEVTGDLLLEER